MTSTLRAMSDDGAFDSGPTGGLLGGAVGGAGNCHRHHVVACSRYGRHPHQLGQHPHDVGQSLQISPNCLSSRTVRARSAQACRRPEPRSLLRGQEVKSQMRLLGVLLGIALVGIPVTPIVGLYLPLRLRRSREIAGLQRALRRASRRRGTGRVVGRTGSGLTGLRRGRRGSIVTCG